MEHMRIVDRDYAMAKQHRSGRRAIARRMNEA